MPLLSREPSGWSFRNRHVNTLYLRGLEEVCHHSLVLKKTTEGPVCERVGMRVYTEDDLEKAKVQCPLYPQTRHQMRHMGCPLRAKSEPCAL